ncbi:hypothetical protein AUI46_03690 [archaeon 13_1_40CM_2_52_13]|nr:MAG: hypothetical protein AUI46_03690 [archaeon 13_1_40CM_2_52_13]
MDFRVRYKQTSRGRSPRENGSILGNSRVQKQSFRQTSVYFIESVQELVMMVMVAYHKCPRCGQSQLNIYFANELSNSLGKFKHPTMVTTRIRLTKT